MPRRPATPEECVKCIRCGNENTEDSGIANVHLQGTKRYCPRCGTTAVGMPVLAYFTEVATPPTTDPDQHVCADHPVRYESDGPLGHGYECGVCGEFLQAG